MEEKKKWTHEISLTRSYKIGAILRSKWHKLLTKTGRTLPLFIFRSSYVTIHCQSTQPWPSQVSWICSRHFVLVTSLYWAPISQPEASSLLSIFLLSPLESTSNQFNLSPVRKHFKHATCYEYPLLIPSTSVGIIFKLTLHHSVKAFSSELTTHISSTQQLSFSVSPSIQSKSKIVDLDIFF